MSPRVAGAWRATGIRASGGETGSTIGRAERLLAGLFALGCLVVLGLSATLIPNPEGSGTHTQLGLPACGWAIAFHHPCPTCGMTTSFAYAAHLRPWESIKAQPLGFFLAVGTAIAFWIALHTALTGSRLARLGAQLLTPGRLWLAAGLLAASWAYKWVTWPDAA